MKNIKETRTSEEFICPASYKAFSKDELFRKFINVNPVLWNEPVFYGKKIVPIYRDCVSAADSNEVTWKKFWVKTFYVVADEYNLYYAKLTLEKVLEKLDNISNEEFAELMLRIDEAIISGAEFSMLLPISENIRLFQDDTTPECVKYLSKNINSIDAVLRDKIKADMVDTRKIKEFAKNDIFNGTCKADFAQLIKFRMLANAVVLENSDEFTIEEALSAVLKNKSMANKEFMEDLMEALKPFAMWEVKKSGEDSGKRKTRSRKKT